MIAVCGAKGYVGQHLIADLVRQGFEVRAISRSPGGIPGADYFQADLFDFSQCVRAVEGADRVYNLAATVGGIGFIGKNKAECMSSAAININLLRALPPAAHYLFASSSCVYSSSPTPLKESDVQPGVLTGYSLEKLYSEKVALAFAEERGVPVRIARLHTVYGANDFRGGLRDHFPSALAVKAVEAKHSGRHEINIFGNGTQRRSLLYIDDAVEGLQKIMNGSTVGPLNLASSEPVSVNSVVDMLEDIAAIKLKRFYCPDAAVGAQDKMSDNTALRAALSWEPCTPARVGLGRLYRSAWDRAMKS